MLCVTFLPTAKGGILNVNIRQIFQCLKEKIPAFIFDYSEINSEGSPPATNALGLAITRIYVSGSGVTIYTASPDMTLTASSLDTNIVGASH